MQQKEIYAVFDTVAGQIFGPVMALPNHAVARRTFQDALFGDGSLIASHPGDYALFHLGSIDLESGVITPVPVAPTTTGPMITGDVLVELATRKPEVPNGT